MKTELSTNRKNKTPIKSYHYIKIVVQCVMYADLGIREESRLHGISPLLAPGPSIWSKQSGVAGTGQRKRTPIQRHPKIYFGSRCPLLKPIVYCPFLKEIRNSKNI